MAHLDTSLNGLTERVSKRDNQDQMYAWMSTIMHTVAQGIARPEDDGLWSAAGRGDSTNPSFDMNIALRNPPIPSAPEEGRTIVLDTQRVNVARRIRNRSRRRRNHP
ncbi:uncharacterized protein I303_105544 [Kwoniella dejecticola CBS 10117]|uniref:Uncharacterized protein n=1 Tax=Kwoniella dejecticola CBS 10117 TaxID=1296121 RepID=A0A1A6A267_9TREE|nr:uncharacterized protein I303_05013 [Kwoniella dejecticola CBS 10117]OBR84156.1 hypothetical protein I303_05013 [Kwoniella dejecticola CBS 10117]